MQPCFRTVLKTGYGEYEEKRSHFLAWVYPVSCEEEVQNQLSELKKKYWDARHHCYAYIIESETTAQRFGDDGEPSGTAGLPILEAIRKKELSNVLVVVVRYFGGVLLGASGLVRAYGKAATAGLDNAGILVRRQCVKTALHIDYSLYGRVQNVLAANGTAISGTSFSEIVEVNLFIEPEKMEHFEKEMAQITCGQARITRLEKVYVNFDEKGNYLS
jgi:uncharacterized YigZ family protein